jgi:hypothetical protein
LYELPNRLERGVLIKNGGGAILTERREIEERYVVLAREEGV